MCVNKDYKWSFWGCVFQIELLEIARVQVFVRGGGGGEQENPERNPESKDKNQQQTQPKSHWWGGVCSYNSVPCFTAFTVFDTLSVAISFSDDTTPEGINHPLRA